MANVSQLQPTSSPQLQLSSSEASEKDADFLALRLVNKRTRLRLSPVPLDLAAFPGKTNLFAIANSKGWFAAVTRDVSGTSALILSPLADLRSSLKAASSEEEQMYNPQRRVTINGALPHILTFAHNDSRMLLGLLDGHIQVYASDQLMSAGQGPLQPLHVFTASSPVVAIQSNPGDIPELVAVLRDCSNNPGSLAVELLDVQKLTSSGGWMAGKSPSTTPTSISWSPKGKQLALGLQSGDIICFSPSATATPKATFPHPPSANNMSVISVRWLSTSSFHTIYAPPGQLAPDVEQTHFHVSFDLKSNSSQAIKFNNPYLPFPGLRSPGEFLVSLRSWNPSKALLFIGDSTSSDIGLIGSVADGSGERWHNFTLEETSTPSLPLDKDQNDTILLGMDADLTSDESYHHSTASGEALELPAHPILFVYASDGTIQGWHVLNITGGPYPGMVAKSNAPTPMLTVPAVPSSIVRELSSDMQTTPTTPSATAAPVEAMSINPPATGFGQPSTFGSQSTTFGQTTTVFGQTQFGFGQRPTSVFGETSPFNQSTMPSTVGSTSTSSSFGQPPKSAFGSTGGFGSFSSAGPAKFGQTTFDFGGSPQITPTLPPSTSIPEESMLADDVPSFDSLGLGSANSQEADSKPTIFGKPSEPLPTAQQSTDGSLIKPGTGFGAFAGFDQKSPFASFSSSQQPTATFGFGAFASGQQSAFAMVASKTGPSVKPVWAAGDSSKPSESSSFGSPTHAFGPPAESPEPNTSAVASQPATSAVVKPGAFGQLPKDSPFFAPKPPENKSSTFALSATPTSTTPRVGHAQPTFGRSSMLAAETSQDTDSKLSIFGKTGAGFAEEKGPAAMHGFSSFASGPESAFAAAASKHSSSAKPVWATGDLSKPVAGSLEPQAPSVIPSKTADVPTSTPPPFTSLTLSTASQFTLRDPKIREDDSRSPSPAPIPTKATSSIFSSSGPGPATGAFSNLQTTPSAFVKPPSGIFGELPKDSPFFAPKPSESKSVFALSTPSSTPTSTPPKASSAQPTFGATSMPGGLKSAFPPPSAAPASLAPGGTSAFSAFSSGGGFAAFTSGGSKSFSDLLRSAEQDKPAKAEPTAATPTKPAQHPPEPHVSTTPAQEPPKSPSPLTPRSEGSVSKTIEAGSDNVPAEPKDKAAETVVGEPSLESISSSTSSSFVKVSVEEEGEAVEEGVDGEELQDEAESLPSSEAPSDAEDDDYQPSEGEESEPSEEESEVSEEEGTEELSETAEGETEKEAPKVTEPTEIPLPTTPASTRSPSTTPKAEPPKISISISPPPQASSPSIAPPPRVSPVRDLGTTPPGSPPVKDTPQATVHAAPKASPPATSPFSLVPRTNNRPIRSSPLASSPLVLEGEVDKPPVVSKSAPPTIVAQPAAPKAPFGQWTPPPLQSLQPTDDASRPGAPPTPSLFSVTIEKPASSIFLSATTPGPSPTVSTPPGKAPTTPFALPSTPGPSTLTFTPPPNFSVFTPSPAIPSPRGPSLTPPPLLTKTPSPVPPTPTPEQGMQAEYALLVATLTKEMENLKQLAIGAAIRTVDLKRTSGVTHQKADLGDPDKWTFGDIEEYGTLLIDIQVDIKELKLQRVSMRKAMKELDSNILKVNTRKEEIARFNKAKTDSEFAKMLKIRTLAPEFSETQSQLRKSIRAIKDRVQKLENHLQDSKKRIHEFRTGRPSIRPPTLDTVNRTLRNIDVAIDQQKQEMSHLRYRMTKLETPGGVDSRDHLTVSSLRRPRNVTPSVAVTTAAALNAERSAQRLKKAMLASRTQPLLNTTAFTSLVPTAFQTPQKTTVVKQEMSTPMMSFPASLPSWASLSPPDFGSPTSPSYDITPSRNRGSVKHHQKPIILKKSPVGTAATLPAVSFEWQPVEPVKPASSLPFSLRPAASN